MEREKGLAKGKILSKKKTKVLFVLNIILSVIMAILILKKIYDRNYSNIIGLLTPLIIITYNFYFLNLNIKERKRLGWDQKTSFKNLLFLIKIINKNRI